MEIAATSTNREERQPPLIKQLAGVAVALALLDFAALLLNSRAWSTGGVTILWPTNGLLLGILLRTQRRQWLEYFAVGFLIDLTTNLTLGFALRSSMYLAGCNMIEVGLAAFLLYKTIAPKPDLTQRVQLVRFLLFGVFLAPAVASYLAQFNNVGPHWPSFVSFKLWFTADTLGIAVMTPLYLSFSQGERFSGRSKTEVVGLLAALCAITVFVFWQVRYPLLFLLFPFLLLLGVRLRLAGAAIGLLIISIVGGYFTIAGRGPTTLIPHSSVLNRELALQFFIATAMLMLYITEFVIAERERLENKLQASETRFRLLAEASSDVIVLADLNGTRRYVSPAITHVLGWLPEELLDRDYRQVVHPDDIDSVSALMKECREGKSVEALPYRCRKKDGSYIWMEASMQLYNDTETGKPLGFVNVVRDISSRKAAEEELNDAFRVAETLAMVDGLTGIANRRRFDEVLENETRRAIRDRSYLSLLMIDVDHFKAYNDLYGHIMGDNCLRQIAVTAQEVIHRTSDVFARYGGEEFAVVLPNTDSRGARLVAELIRSAVEDCRLPHLGSAHEVVTISIGCATQTLSPESPQSTLLEDADHALYEAKSAGRNCIEVAHKLGVAQ